MSIKNTDGKTVMTVPVDAGGNLMINYAGSEKMFPHVSAADVLSDSPKMDIDIQKQDPKSGRWAIGTVTVDKKEFFKDKLFIFGATAIGVFDLRVTPFEENYPGVETHANVLSNLLV
jgi:adenylate cyclase